MAKLKLTALPSRLMPLPPRVRALPKVADGFYASREWRGLIARIKRVRGAVCQRCGSSYRIIGDHIVERRDGGAELDAGNIELLCQACHNRKTAQARAERAMGAR